MIVQGKGITLDVNPGDTIFLLPGTYRNLRLVDLQGTKQNPIVVTNHPSGKATIKSDHYYGISLNYCAYVHITGNSSTEIQYGIEITDVNGNGIGGTRGSYGLTIDHVYIHNVAGSGIQIKTDAKCGEFNRTDFVIKDISIHHCLIEHTGTEGLYIGSTQYKSFSTTCNDETRTLAHPMIENLAIYANNVSYTGWDAIQVASSINSSVHDNFIEYDSQAKFPNQMSGIAIGAGANPTVYNNTIQYGNGNGVSCFGLGGTKIYNNIIVEPGFGFSSVYGEYGIYFNNKEDDSQNQETVVAHNLIVSPNVGMKFDRSYSDSNKYFVYNNLIVAPKDLDHYSSIDKEERAFIQVPYLEVDYKGNIHQENMNDEWFQDCYSSDFNPTWESGVIDSGEELPHFEIESDMSNAPRLQGLKPDVGPFESPYQFNTNLSKEALGKLAFQNPISSLQWQWTIDQFEEGIVEISMHQSNGTEVKKWTKLVDRNRSSFVLTLPHSLVNGVYVLTVKQGSTHMAKPVVVKVGD
jgi:hypothetical protein